jgi:hypothetical protein
MKWLIIIIMHSTFYIKWDRDILIVLNIFLFQIHKFLDMFMNLTKEGKEKLDICQSIFTKKKKKLRNYRHSSVFIDNCKWLLFVSIQQAMCTREFLEYGCRSFLWNGPFMLWRVFENMIAVDFKVFFFLKIHQNNIYFFIFKKLFLISTHQNDLKI